MKIEKHPLHRFLILLLCVAWPCRASISAEPREDLPFEVGEQLTYDIKWNPPRWLFILPGTYHVGQVKISVAETLDFETNRAYKLTLHATSNGILPKIGGVTVDDFAESISDARTLCSYHLRKKIREGKRKRDVEINFLAKEKKIAVREIDVEADPPRDKRTETFGDTPSCVNDVLSAFYAMRLKQLQVNERYKMFISDEGGVKQIEIKVLKRGRIKLSETNIPAVEVEAVGVFGGLFRAKGEFFVWLSDDARRLPLKFEAKVKYGRIQGSLTSPARGG